MNTGSSTAKSRVATPPESELIRALIFDYGGVLTFAPTEQDWQDMAATMDVPLPSFLEEYWNNRYPYEIAQFDSRTYWERVAHLCGTRLTHNAVRELVRLDNEQWGRQNPGMIALSRELRAAGMQTAVLSNIQPDMLSFVNQRHPWMREFDVRVYSCEVGVAKPAPGIFLHATRLLGLPPEHCFFVDDRQPNVQGAQQVGIKAMQFDSPQSADVLRQRLSGLGVKLTVTT